MIKRRKIQFISIVFLFLFAVTTSYGQFSSYSDPVITSEEFSICNDKFSSAKSSKLYDRPMNEIIKTVGLQFLGTPYKAAGNEKNANNQLFLKASSFDCVTYLECTLVLSRCIKQKKWTSEEFKRELIFVRYRNGVMDTYPSCLTYFSDWINDNIKKGVVTDITKKIGGEPLKFTVGKDNSTEDPKPVNFGYYQSIIKLQESDINNRLYYYIPKDRVDEIENKLLDGDLIAITASENGMDISHVGYAVRMQDGRIHLLHATINSNNVAVTDKPLSEYMNFKPNQTGIIVLRAKSPI